MKTSATRKELAAYINKNQKFIVRCWSNQIFKVPGHRKVKGLVSKKTHAKGMDKFISSLAYDISNPPSSTCNSVLHNLVMKDYLSLSNADDTVHGLIILRDILAGMLIKAHKSDFRKLRDIMSALVYAIDKSIMCFMEIYKQRDFARFQTITKYGEKLLRVNDLDKVCNLALEAAMKESKADRGSLMLIDKDGFLRIKCSFGIKKSIVQSTKQRVGRGIAGRVVKSGEPILINEGQKLPASLRKDLRGHGLKSAICVPVVVDDKVAGVINVVKFTGNPFFNQHDAELLLVLGYETGAAISNCRLVNEVHELYLGSIISLAAAIDTRDHYTHGHSSKVAKLATEVAKRLNMGADDLERIYFASMLHDIGKIGIPDKILLKPGKLTEKEFNVVKKHPAYGVKILKHIPRLKSIVPIIYHEHERYDGKGYAKGLKGKDIPVESRIIAICDAYEAMTSDRPYRKALAKKIAVAELKKCSGSQFDPNVVKAFLKVVK
ncbi:HD domain-containing phosphohydrolase [Candidatus Omnitrophota bacterium]